ncbi:hypothetical protein R3P38DRAFT_2769683 [Favolaschia claudopus]|uniref:Uncharacterized protein n=1 Tax=Favolaschia claudopus TaxID=2862362 RepID=A0AAW0CLW8_9AGAR
MPQPARRLLRLSANLTELRVIYPLPRLQHPLSLRSQRSDSLKLKRAYNGCDVPKGLILRLDSDRSQDAEQPQESPLKLSKPTIKVVGEGNKPIRIKRWGALEFLFWNQCNFLCRASTVNPSFARILTRFRGPRVPVYRRIETSSLCNGRKRIFSSQFSDNRLILTVFEDSILRVLYSSQTSLASGDGMVITFCTYWAFGVRYLSKAIQLRNAEPPTPTPIRPNILFLLTAQHRCEHQVSEGSGSSEESRPGSDLTD